MVANREYESDSLHDVFLEPTMSLVIMTQASATRAFLPLLDIKCRPNTNRHDSIDLRCYEDNFDRFVKCPTEPPYAGLAIAGSFIPSTRQAFPMS